MKKIKVCMLLNNPFTHDARVYKEASSLVETGYEVTVLCVKNELDLPTEETVDGIKVKRVLMGWLPHIVDIRNRSHLVECRNFLRAAIAENADIYHAHDFNTLFYGAYCKKKNISKLVYDSHEYWQGVEWGNNTKFKKFIYHYYASVIEKIFIKNADEVITVSQPIAESLKKDYRLDKLPVVIPNSQLLNKLKKIDLYKLFGIKEAQKIIIHTGNISSGRGLENVVRSLRYINNAVLVLVGKNLIGQSFIDLIKSEKAEGRVFFTGQVAMNDLIGYTSGADLGIISFENTCKNHYFAAPNKLYLYLGAGIPIVSPSYPGLCSVIDAFGVGDYFEPENPKSIAKTINKIFENSKIYKQFAQNSKKAQKELNWTKDGKKLVALYGELS